MRILKSNSLLKLVNSYMIDSPQPSNLNYNWNYGSLLATSLVIQIITGVTLAMHYNATVLEAFESVEHIMRDVNNGWLIRYFHSNTASAFFFVVYLHIGRGLYYGSYKAPRTLVWTIGTILFILMMATAFLGYVLPYGQMSLWGATVITSLMGAIPWIGQDIVEFVWGGFSVNNATLNRFFALHFVLPFILAGLAMMHLIVLHDRAGSGNPLGGSGNCDRLPFAPYFIFKDLITLLIFILVLSAFVFFMPNLLGDSENYVMANPMQTPPAIVPEWYLLPFYAILRSIPNKLFGVIAMFIAILILLITPFIDLSKLRGSQFKPLSKWLFFVFVANFIILMELGAKHVESPFIEFGQISTVFYFANFLIIVPFFSIFESSMMQVFKKGINLEDRFSLAKTDTYLVESSFIINYFSGKGQVYAYGQPKPAWRPSNNGEWFQRADGSWDWVEWGVGIMPGGRPKPQPQPQPQPKPEPKSEPKPKPKSKPNKRVIFILLIPLVATCVAISFIGLIIMHIDTSIIDELTSIFTISRVHCDAPRPWGIYFQDSATPQMEALVELHDNILFYLVIILFGVGWLLISIVKNYTSTEAPISHKYQSHGTLIELIWTITPALILILIAFPSFKLLYLMDEVTDPAMAVLAEGHQWYWSYQYPDFLNSDNEFLEFDSYLIPEPDLVEGALRMLEVDNRLIIPELTHIRFIVSGGDVIHSLACPAIGIKCDGYPGRLNQTSVMVNREGTFYGQCSEICGLLHSSMPIVMQSVCIEKFISWLTEQ